MRDGRVNCTRYNTIGIAPDPNTKNKMRGNDNDEADGTSTSVKKIPYIYQQSTPYIISHVCKI